MPGPRDAHIDRGSRWQTARAQHVVHAELKRKAGKMPAIVDYWAGTVQDMQAVDCFHYFASFVMSWREERGHHGYTRCWASEGVRIYYEGQPGMGVHVQISGEGCREVESSPWFSSWGAFLQLLRDDGFRDSRLDLAYDDRTGTLNRQTVEDFLGQGSYTSPYQILSDKGARKSGEVTDWRRYLGKASADSSLCIYDKQLETISKGSADPGHWLRFEVRYRQKAAVAVASWVIEHADMVGSECWLASAITFKVPSGDGNRSRWPIADWWASFLGAVSRMTRSKTQHITDLQQLTDRFVRQHSATLAMLAICHQGTVSAGEWVRSLLQTGWGRLTKRHTAVILAIRGRWQGQGTLLPVIQT